MNYKMKIKQKLKRKKPGICVKKKQLLENEFNTVMF